MRKLLDFFSQFSQSRLSWLLVAKVFGFSMIVALALTAMQYAQDIEESDHVIASRFELISRSAVNPLSLALWNYDMPSIALIANGLGRQADISGVSVFDYETQIYGVGTMPSDGVIQTYPLLSGDAGRSDQKQIGRLVVSVDRAGVRERVYQHVKDRLIANVIQMLLVSSFLMLLIERQLFRHIRRASDFVSRRSSENLSESLVLNRVSLGDGQDELSRLQDGINRMQSNLRLVIDELKDDIAKREIAEAEVRGITAARQAILDGARQTIIATDLNGLVTSFNRAAEGMLGYSAEEVIGRLSATTWLDPAELQIFAQELASRLGKVIEPSFQALVVEIPAVHEWTFIAKDGHRFPVELSVTSVHGADGTLMGYMGVATDITERKRVEAELELHRRGLEGLVAIRTRELSEANASLVAAKLLTRQHED